MLPKHQRLNLKTDFTRVIKGRRFETPHFIVYSKPTDQDIVKVGISIRTKNFGKAHNRNRARRLTSEAIQKLFPLISLNQDLIIMPKSGLLESTTDVLSKELEHVLVGN